jgi:hypothetical protein
MIRRIGVVALAACGSRSTQPPTASSGSSTPDADPVAAVNALVPAELRGQLQFEQRTVSVKGRRFTLPVPIGWKDDGTPNGNLERPDEPKHDGPPYFASGLTVRGNACDGDWTGKGCSSSPAAFQVEDGLLKPIKKDGKVLAERVSATEHLLELDDQFATYAIRAWWNDGAQRFAYCAATLTDPLRAARAAFAAACAAAREAS